MFVPNIYSHILVTVCKRLLLLSLIWRALVNLVVTKVWHLITGCHVCVNLTPTNPMFQGIFTKVSHSASASIVRFIYLFIYFFFGGGGGGVTSLSTLYRSYHSGQFCGQRKPVHTVGVEVLFCRTADHR